METSSYIVSYVVMGMAFYAWALWNKKQNRNTENVWAAVNLGSQAKRS